jgi:pyruvate-formate lyase-activating enzyme
LDLIDFIKKIKKELNILIKLDTNGLQPDFIRQVSEFVDFFAIDIKTTPDLYQKKLGTTFSEEEIEIKLLETKKILSEIENKEIEYRTTMYPPIVESYERLYKMMEYIPSNANHYLQRFIPETSWDKTAQQTKSYSQNQIENMVKELRKNTGNQNIFMRTYL